MVYQHRAGLWTFRTFVGAGIYGCSRTATREAKRG
jgi:hypothetical protein